MALTAAQYRKRICVELGGDSVIEAQLPSLWAEADDAGTLREQYLRTKIAAIDILLGRYALQVSFRALDGASVNLSDVTDHLRRLRADAEAALASESGAAGGYVAGEIAKVVPVDQPEGAPDANDRALRGDPYRPPTTWRP